jgi:hypothetical protein
MIHESLFVAQAHSEAGESAEYLAIMRQWPFLESKKVIGFQL